jgi:hypothetical protein
MGNYTGVILGFHWVKTLSNLNPPHNSGGVELVGPNATWEAKQYIFYFSVDQLRARVSTGNYFEEVVDEYSGDGIGFADPALQQPLSLTPPFTDGQSFNISALSFQSIVSEYVAALGPLNYLFTGSSNGLSLLFDSGNKDLVLRLWYARNITRIMQNLNVYVTNSLRANQSALLPNLPGQRTIDPGTSINGTVWITEPFVQVEWAWLTMPLFLCLLVGIFLFLTMLRSSQRGVGVWKSNPLEFMVHGIPEDQRQKKMRTIGTASADEMDSCAEEVKVRLAPDQKGVLCLLPK